MVYEILIDDVSIAKFDTIEDTVDKILERHVDLPDTVFFIANNQNIRLQITPENIKQANRDNLIKIVEQNLGFGF